jgi:hypothetical protein
LGVLAVPLKQVTALSSPVWGTASRGDRPVKRGAVDHDVVVFKETGDQLEGLVVSFDDNNRFDASDRDGKVDLRRWPVLGGYMPDGIQALRVGGSDYLVTANEGDTRHYDARRLAEVELDAARFPEAAALQSSAMLGRLKVSAREGDLDGDGDVDEIHAFGARSVSIWDGAGNLVADTGSLFEEVTALALSEAFNSNNDENGSFDTRSDDKGPEPEGLEVAEIDGRVYAFVGLERVTGRIGGKSGSFVLQRTGVFEDGRAKEAYTVIRGSGTGELHGISGDGHTDVGHGMEHPFGMEYELR